MKEPITLGTNCVVCSEKFTNRDRDILFLSDFNQSWCETCILKHIESYPINDIKMNAKFEIQRIYAIIKNK
jgi:hypothetical protein